MIAPDRQQLSPNFHAGPPRGRGVVIHATRSGVSMNPSELQGTINWFMRRDVGLSAHWVIGRNGEKVRMVLDSNRAVHAGEHNDTHWGIELCQGVEADGFTEAQIDALVAVCRGYVEDFGVPPIFSLSGFIGHEDTPQGMRVGKSDPGRLFPWDDFIRRLVGADHEEEEMASSPVWADWKDRPDHIPYRSYLLFATPAGLKKRHVRSSEEHNSIAATDVAGVGLPKHYSLAVLKTFEGGPEPDEA